MSPLGSDNGHGAGGCGVRWDSAPGPTSQEAAGQEPADTCCLKPTTGSPTEGNVLCHHRNPITIAAYSRTTDMEHACSASGLSANMI